MAGTKVKILFEDWTFNNEVHFLEKGSEEELAAVARKRGISLPSRDLAPFKCAYAFVDEQNANKCTLPREEVEKALHTLIGKAVDTDHIRGDIGGHWIDYELEGDTIISYGVFFKSNLPEEYAHFKEKLENNDLKVSFEAWGETVDNDKGGYDLINLEFAGGALLDVTEPAFREAEVFEFARVYGENEDIYETAQQKYTCECIECGHTIKTDKHCADLKCSECGGQMRRKDSPGPGQGDKDRGRVVFSKESKKVLDDRDHFPINDADQARNALARVKQYDKSPKWYDGPLSEVVKKVQNKVGKEYPSIDVTKGDNKVGDNKDNIQNQNNKDTDNNTNSNEGGEKMELKEKVEKLEKEAATKDEELKDLKEEISTKDETIKTLKDESEESKKKIEDIEKEVSKKVEKAKKEAKKIAKRRAELDADEKEISDKDILDDLKFKNLKLEKQLASLKEKLEGKEEDDDEDEEDEEIEDANLEIGNKEKKKRDGILFEIGKNVQEYAFPEEGE